MATTCYRCGAALQFDGPIGRRASCPECDFDLHACINCRHYDEAAARSCREPHADMIVHKEISNACDLFQLGDGASHRRGSGRAAKEALHALFGEGAPKEESPRDALEALFKKK